MPEKMLFADMVHDFALPFTAFQETGGHYNDAGDWIKGGVMPVQMTGIILPLADDELHYSASGTYTTKDRKLYTLTALKEGQKIEYKGIPYTVQEFKDYTDYADVFIYIARWAG